MYIRYAETADLKIEEIEAEKGEAGGYSRVSFMVKGENVYSKLKYESGAHRVQRVPATESLGRVHTSTSTVLVMPEAEEIDVEINPNDVRVDVFRSSGKGGQGVNTTDSAVRLTHGPTGIVVSCQDERSQIKNKDKAMKVLRSRVYDETLRLQEKELGVERRNKIGTGDRSEKIRTYNYPQNRVTDHRIGYTLKQLDRVMDGMLAPIIEALITEDQNRKLRGE
jgi:peptide chain release factor 1